jgi:ubiquinone biosynthesis protein
VADVLIYVVGWALWPVVFGALAGRLLGIEIGRLRGMISGLVGVVIGALVSDAASQPRESAQNFVVYLFAALAGTLACVAALDFLARPATVGRLELSIGSRAHPLRAARRRVARACRYATILRIAARHGLLSALAGRTGSPDPARAEHIGRELSDALQEAGGIFVKLGQILSTRADLLPETVVGQLAVLHDRVAPAPPAAVRALLEAELGRSPHEVFARFEDDPLAAASIGQVHRAQLHGGREVVVKVQRPDVDELVERDLDIILELARRVDASTSWGRRAGAVDLACGFADNLREELDYRIEARNTKTVAKQLEARHELRVPAVHDALTTRRVIVLEWLDGTPLRQAAPRLRQLGVDPTDVARTLLASFLTQVLEAGVFNADPNPGNVLVMADGTLALLDFGSVGRLHPAQRLALARLLMAIDRGDPELLRESLLELSTATGRVDLDALDRALAGFLVQRLGPGMRPGADMFNDLLALLTGFGLAFDAQLAGVFRALLTLEGTLRILAPEFAMVDEAKTLASTIGRQAFGPNALREAVGDDLVKLAPILRRLPARLDRITADMERGDWSMNVRLLADERDARLLSRLVDRAIVVFISAAIGLISAVLVGVESGVALTAELTLAQALGYLGLAVASLLGIRVLVAVSRDRVI